MNSSFKTCTSSPSRWICLWLTVWFAAAGFFFLRGTDSASVASVQKQPLAIKNVGHARAPQRTTKSIELIQVGERVHVELPVHLQEQAIGALENVPVWDRLEAKIIARDWRKIDLEMRGEEGDLFNISLLRPAAWLDGATAGDYLCVELPEQGLSGPALVLSVEACPPIADGRGRVVTGTLTHVRGGILRLHLEGIDKPLGVTANHTVYSVDRNAFLPAGELYEGECLRHLDGLTYVERIEQLSSEARVYNLEVHGAHVYHVTDSGVLVHNASARTGTSGGTRSGKNFTRKGKQEVLDENANANGGKINCEECGTGTVPSAKSQKGVTPPSNEAQVDHIIPKSKGGDGSPSNGQVLCRHCNRLKSNN